MRYLREKPLIDIIAACGFLCVVGFLIFAAIWSYRQYRSTPPYVDTEKYPIKGIDVSRHNGNIDYKKVKEAGIDFVFIKASEGVTYRDSLFNQNFENAGRNGLKTGAYHFFRFDCDGVDQALNFLRAIGPRHLELGLVIDVESAGNPPDIDAEIVKKRLSSMVEYMNLLGHRVMIYTNLDGYYDFMADILPGYPLWICRFKENPINAEWTFWQYEHHGKVDGVNGEVDLNVFCGNYDDWERYLQGELWPYTGE